MKRQKNYDKKVKLTRILLADYQTLKVIAREAGISMAVALHELITQVSKPKPEPAQIPMFQVKARPVITTNGHKPIYARTINELRLNVKPTVEFQARAKGVINGRH